MTLRSGALVLAVALGIGSVAAWAEESETVKFDKSFPLPADGVDVIPVKAKVGSVVVDDIRLNNLPNEQEVKVAVANNTDDKCRPKIAVLFSNPTALKMKAKVVATFESADGTVLFSCDRKDRINPFADGDRTDVCFGFGALTSMQLRHWPKVKKVHIVADISRDK